MRMPDFTKPSKILVAENSTDQSTGLIVAPLNLLAVSEDLLYTLQHLFYTFKFSLPRSMKPLY